MVTVNHKRRKGLGPTQSLVLNYIFQKRLLVGSGTN